MKTNIKWIRREFTSNYYSNNRREDRFKNDSRTDQSITTTEEVINLNPPPYECNKNNNHCILNIWKNETGIKINFDLWKP